MSTDLRAAIVSYYPAHSRFNVNELIPNGHGVAAPQFPRALFVVR